ncbi:sugar ABC transporter permease [Aquabacterium sp. A7-Y]|uniref:carbohydrate ABC transporter permease n=1 Tax=Aquabacterium sp. A7-Y TaxID=1349605 RepID=UPI00223E3424|nr:sugar ABC transporter permease [Aquabacterium sp. A7-Y]MCW7540590.1 sugar ABC transporter permease [Aquabacterium sp. A7-Y]
MASSTVHAAVGAASAAPEDVRRAPRAASLSARRARRAWLMLAPAMLLLLLVAGWPLGRTIWFSLTDAQLGGQQAPGFVGLENYLGEYGLLRDGDWWRSVGNTLGFALLSVSIETLLGLGVALLLNHPSRLRTLLRAAMLIPWAIPTVVSAKMWSWMLHDQFGVVNHYLLSLGLLSAPVAWTANPDLALFTVVLVDVWKTTPFMALLILAALQMVPADCYEAARVDGVPPWTVFRRVTLPLILPGVAVAMIFRLLDALRVFDLIYVMTSNSRSTKSMSVFVREQLIDFQQVGYGSAAATVVFFTIALLTLLYMALLRPALEKVDQ